MVGPANGSRTGQALSVVNGVQDLAVTGGPASNAGSDCGGIEFTKEYVEALLSEKMKTKNKSNLKMLMKAKEEESNSIIMELRKNYASLQEKIVKEESVKLAAMDSFTKEKEARVAAERLQTSLSEDLGRVQRESSGANQKIFSLNDMYNRLQEYNTSLQQYNSKLQSDLAIANETLKLVEKEKAAVVENLSNLRGHYNSLQDQLTSSRSSQDEAMKLKDALLNEVGCLKGDMLQTRDDRDRQLSQVPVLTTEVVKYKECTGNSSAEMDSLRIKSNELEMSDLSTLKTRIGFEEQKKVICELQSHLVDADLKITEGEKLRKKLHNTILSATSSEC